MDAKKVLTTRVNEAQIPGDCVCIARLVGGRSRCCGEARELLARPRAGALASRSTARGRSTQRKKGGIRKEAPKVMMQTRKSRSTWSRAAAEVVGDDPNGQACR